MKITIKNFALLIPCLLVSFILCAQMPNESVSEKSVATTPKDNEIKWGDCPPFMPEGCKIAVLHGDPSKKNVDIYFKVDANSDIPNHWHNSAERMVLVSGEMEVHYDNEEPQLLKTGMYAYGPAKKPHTAKCLDKGPCVLFIAFEEPLDAFPITMADN